MNTHKTIKTGGCLCESVRFELSGELRPVVACHCNQCQKTSGHYVAATASGLDNFKIIKSSGLKWYRSSSTAERGFCTTCGGNLFWKRMGADTISIFAGTLDHPTELSLAKHIHVSDKSDYYDITDDLPQH